MVFQNGQGCPWFHAEASFLPKKLVVEKRTRKYAFQQPAGVIRSAPCIRYHYFQKRWKGNADARIFAKEEVINIVNSRI